MPLPDLCIAPHEAGELAPDEPLYAPATHRVWVWSLLWGGYYLVRPVKTLGGFRMLVARHQTRENAPVIQLERAEQDRMSTALRKGRFYRYLHFDKEGKLASSRYSGQVTLFVSSPGCPIWRTRAEYGRFEWDIRGARPKEYLSRRWRATTPAAQIEEEVGQMLADPSSDCAFAWRWAHLSRREQICLLFHTDTKVLDECEMMLRCVLWTDPTWKDDPDCHWLLNFRPDSTSSSSTINTAGGALSSEILSNSSSFPLSSRLFQLLELVLRVYELRFNPRPSDKTPMRNCGWMFWKVSALIPTQHERLEARLRLRDWLQDKVAPEEVPFLLGEIA